MDTLKKALGLDLPTSTRGMTMAALGLLALALVAVQLVWFFGGAEKIMGLFIAISLAFVAGIFAATGIYLSIMQASQLRQMLAGDYWAHWNYTDQDVRHFSQHETVRTKKDMRFSFFFAIVFGLVVGGLMWLLTSSQAFGLLTGGFAFLLGIALFLQDAGRGKAYVYPEPGVNEIYLGQQGVYQPGKFFPFDHLLRVELEGGDPPLTLLFYIVVSTYSKAPVRVGVPYGREAEAKQLVERFRTWLDPENAA